MGKNVRWRVKQLRRETAARLGRDVKLEEVSQQTGIGIATLSNIENNKTKGVEFATLSKLAEFYGVTSPDDLLVFEDAKRAPRGVPA